MRKGESMGAAALIAWATVLVMVAIIVGILTRSPNIALGITLLGGCVYGYLFRRHL